MLPCCQRHLHYSFSNAATWLVLELFIILVYMSLWNSSFLFCMLIGYRPFGPFYCCLHEGNFFFASFWRGISSTMSTVTMLTMHDIENKILEILGSKGFEVYPFKVILQELSIPRWLVFPRTRFLKQGPAGGLFTWYDCNCDFCYRNKWIV